jgi:hypothetical protein
VSRKYVKGLTYRVDMFITFSFWWCRKLDQEAAVASFMVKPCVYDIPDSKKTPPPKGESLLSDWTGAKPLIQDQKAIRFMNKKMDKLPRSVKK